MQAALVRVLADDTFVYTPHQTLVNRLFMALGDSNSFLGVCGGKLRVNSCTLPRWLLQPPPPPSSSQVLSSSQTAFSPLSLRATPFPHLGFELSISPHHLRQLVATLEHHIRHV